MNNSIFQYSIGELLDGRFFYIPAYQRGYRWTEKQVDDLLRDLLCFAYDPKSEYDFYCLQPIIARPITDEATLHTIFNDNDLYNEAKIKKVWEIVDGQQRFTTIFLIYKYLINKKGWTAEDLYDEEMKEMYHLYYETRKSSTSFLDNIEKYAAEPPEKSENIDYFYMSRAYAEIGRWIKEDGKEINERYHKGPSLGKIRDTLFDLLNGMRDNVDGSVQVLWYELAERNGGNSIREFQKINTGKIRLTDAELIKGLFLLKRNFDSEGQYIKQSQLALEWEFIENTLHANNFWYFLQKKGTDMPNRIDLLFRLIYKINVLKGTEESKWSSSLKQIDKNLADPRQSEIFRFYYKRFEGKNGEELQRTVDDSWNEVMNLFRTLDDWFNTPILYNNIGLLSQCGEDLSRLVLFFYNMDEDEPRDSFGKYLLECIKWQLRNVNIDEECNITNTYREHDEIFKLLLALNIQIMNEQNQLLESDSDIYKFPFDVLNAQDWDIEHIDSYQTNALKRDSDKIEWIQTARSDRDKELSDEEKTRIDECLRNGWYKEAMEILKKNSKEEQDDEQKNTIGNLTLLDATTNRKYGNSLFCTKRRIIIDRITQGVFVPIATQYVFSKFFDRDGTNRSYWTQNDMDEYHKYVYNKLRPYISKE